MILTIIVFGAAIAFVLCALFVDDWEHEFLSLISSVLAIIFCVISILMLIGIICEHANPEKKISALQARREALVYQMENGFYLGDSLGEFNREIISGRYTRESPWTSWFMGDYIYEVDPIELPSEKNVEYRATTDTR